MHESACRQLIVENGKIFRIYVKFFDFSHVKEMVETSLLYANKFL